MRIGQLPADAAVERGVLTLSFLLERERAPLDRVEDVAEVQGGDVADRLVRRSVVRRSVRH